MLGRMHCRIVEFLNLWGAYPAECQTGKLRAVIAKLFLERNTLRTISFFANKALSPEIHVQVGHGGLKVLLFDQITRK